MAQILKGIEVVNGMKDSLIAKNKELIEKGVTPCLNIVRIGKNEDDLSYERGALKRFEGLGIKVQVSIFDENITHDEFEKEFIKINENKNVHGILVFRPMPKHIDEEKIKKLINPIKDIDCMCYENIAKVFTGDKSGYAPCTPTAVVELLKYYDIKLNGKKAVIVGRSMVVGKPLSMLLLNENVTVTICHTKTKNIYDECKNADIVIAAAGVPKLITDNYVNEDTIIIDVGINVDENGKLCGDVDFDKVSPKVSKITPVPKGVGTVTTSILALHVLKSAENSL